LSQIVVFCELVRSTLVFDRSAEYSLQLGSCFSGRTVVRDVFYDAKSEGPESMNLTGILACHGAIQERSVDDCHKRYSTNNLASAPCISRLPLDSANPVVT